MRAFITGGTGFIGSRLIREMAGRGYELRCLARKSSPAQVVDDIGAEKIIGDVTDRKSLIEGMQGVDLVVNLANVYSFWEPDKSVFQKVNVEGTRLVMECALELGIGKVVHISTCGIWGKPSRLPFTEDTLPGPERFSQYFQTKYEGDVITWELFKTSGLPVVMVYPVSVLGPGDPKASGQYIRRLVTGGMPARVFEDSTFTFVDVGDVAEIIIRAAEKPDNVGEKYIAGNHRYTFGELNRMVSEISGVPLPRLAMPDFMVMANARLLTMLAGLTKRPPLWDMSVGLMQVMQAGAAADGTKAERELGVSYRPIRETIAETVASIQ
jgi:dihydroflavonol-4-reductase